MRRLLWWLGKEVREHRLALVLLLLVVLGGSWGIVHLGRWRPLPKADSPSPAVAETGAAVVHRLRPEQWRGLVLGGLGLGVLVLAGGILSGEARRGTLPLIARAPGAWRTALPAKVVFLALALGMLVLAQGAFLGALAGPYALANDGPLVGPEMRAPPRPWLILPQGEQVIWAWCLVGLSAWMLVASAVLPLVGVPALVGAVVGAGLALPFVLWHDEHRYLFRWWLGGLGPVVTAWGALALLLALAAWQRGLRFGRSAWQVGWRTGVAALVLSGAGVGATYAAVMEYRDFTPQDPDVRLEDVLLAGRFACVEAHRGDPDDSPPSPAGALPGTRTRVWRVDLDSGRWEGIGGYGAGLTWTSSGGGGSDGTPFVVLMPGERDHGGLARLDVETGRRGPGPERFDDPLPEDLLPRAREYLRASTPVRDSAGQPAWLLGNRLERASGPSIPLHSGPFYLCVPVEGGWHAFTRQAAGYDAFGRTVDASTGQIRLGVPQGVDLSRWEVGEVLDTARRLLTPAGQGLSRTTLGEYRVLNLDDGQITPLLQAPAAAGARDVPLAILGLRQALVLRPTSQGLPQDWPAGVESPFRSLVRVDLATGSEADVTWEGGRGFAHAEFASAAGTERYGRAQLAGRPFLVHCMRSAPPGAAEILLSRDPSRIGPSPRPRLENAWALYDPGTNRLSLLASEPGGLVRVAPLRVEADGSVLALEEQRRLVRLGPAPGARVVLFPR